MLKELEALYEIHLDECLAASLPYKDNTVLGSQSRSFDLRGAAGLVTATNSDNGACGWKSELSRVSLAQEG